MQIDLVSLAVVLAALALVAALTWRLCDWLLGRTVRCDLCPAIAAGLRRRAARAWARDHAAQYHTAPTAIRR